MCAKQVNANPIFVMDKYITDKRQYTYYSYPLNEPVQYHWHNYFEITYIVSGSATHLLNDSMQVLKPGDLIFIRPNDAHMFYNDTNVFVRIFSFMPSFPDASIMDTVLDSAKSCVVSLNSTGMRRIDGYLQTMGELYDEDTDSNERYLRCLLSAMCLEIGKSIQYEGPEIPGYAKWNNRIREILAYIDRRYMDDLTLESMSEQFGITPNYFSEFFKKHVNTTFSKYLTYVRMRHAISLMPQEELSMEEIAAEVGFKSESYFAQAFKRLSGLSPKAYQIKILRSAKNRKILK